jgi:hypothetical protein
MVAAALADLRSGRPFFFLDPHGTAADMLVRHAQAIGTELSVFDATDVASMRLSPVPALRADGANLDEVEAALAHFCDAVANNYTDPSWSGPRWLQQARAIAYVSAAHGVPLSDALSWYADPQGRRLAAAHPALPGPVRQTLRLLDSPGNNDAASLIDWVTCKFEPLVTGSVGRLLAGPDAGARLSDLISRGGPVIANLAGLPPSGTGIFGHILLGGVLDAAMARPTNERPLFRVYVDEVHRFPARNLERALNESRKFSVSVWAATQSLAVLGDQLGDTVIGATALKFVFRVSPDSALRMAPLLGVPATSSSSSLTGFATSKRVSRSRQWSCLPTSPHRHVLRQLRRWHRPDAPGLAPPFALWPARAGLREQNRAAPTIPASRFFSSSTIPCEPCSSTLRAPPRATRAQSLTTRPA